MEPDDRMATLLARYPRLTEAAIYGMVNVMRWSRDGSAPSIHEKPVTDDEWAELLGGNQ